MQDLGHKICNTSPICFKTGEHLVDMARNGGQGGRKTSRQMSFIGDFMTKNQ
jgi:hypothetical protein